MGVSSGIASGLIGRAGTKPVIIAGALITGAGLFLLFGIPDDGSYLTDLLPGLLVVSLGIGGVFVGTTTAANAGVPPTLAGLAAALVNASQQIGGALGLAIFSAIATSQTNRLLAGQQPLRHALTSGFQRALIAAALSLALDALIAIWTRSTRGDHHDLDQADLTHAGSDTPARLLISGFSAPRHIIIATCSGYVGK